MENLLIVDVIYKRFKFSKCKTYTIYFLFTPINKKIYKIINNNNYKHTFKLGDSIIDVEKWCVYNNFHYITKKRQNRL